MDWIFFFIVEVGICRGFFFKLFKVVREDLGWSNRGVCYRDRLLCFRGEGIVFEVVIGWNLISLSFFFYFCDVSFGGVSFPTIPVGAAGWFSVKCFFTRAYGPVVVVGFVLIPVTVFFIVSVEYVLFTVAGSFWFRKESDVQVDLGYPLSIREGYVGKLDLLLRL